METGTAIEVKGLKKKYKSFCLDIPRLKIPEGFATALIGENGAGKSTLMNILAGVRKDYEGEIIYYSQEELSNEELAESIGYVGTKGYFMPHWTIKAIGEISELIFTSFHKDRYRSLCENLGLTSEKKKMEKLSEGMKMKTALAAVWARDTRCLLLDEPASSLDPLMRGKLCEMIGAYLAQEEGKKTVFFSTHNIADMEGITDYCIIMDRGKILEQGYVEDLKEKYILIKGEEKPEEVKKILLGFRLGTYGYEGICRVDQWERIAGINVLAQRPTLSQISIALMKQAAKERG